MDSWITSECPAMNSRAHFLQAELTYLENADELLVVTCVPQKHKQIGNTIWTRT